MTAKEKLDIIKEIVDLAECAKRDTPAEYLFGILDSISVIVHAYEEDDE